MTRLVLAPVAVLAACCATAAASAQPPIAAKQAQAAAVLAQINAIDIRLGHTVDAFDGAHEQLGATERSIAANRTAIRVSAANLKRARARVSALLVELYVSDRPSSLDILLGATSLQDVLDRLNAADDVSAQDRRIAAAALRLQSQLDSRRRALARERVARAATVSRLAARRAEIRGALAHRQRLLASIKGQIADLRAQQRAREQLLAARARARIARELAARQAAQRAAARKDAVPAQPAPAAPAPATTTNGEAPPTAPSTPAPAPVAPAPAAGGHPEAAAIAARYLGVPYRWGGASPAGFDCSGLVMYVYAQLGISLPHYTVAQYGAGTPVARGELQPGDLVFFDGLGHVGIYIGGGQFIHAPHTGDVVRVSSLSESWYAATYVGARRI